MGKPAARVSDPTACPVPGHGTNPIAAGSPDVIIEGLAAARKGDVSACGGAIVGGVSATVTINGMNAATVGSVGSHGNSVTAGSGTVIIGDVHSPAPFVAPAPVVLQWAFNQHFVVTDPLTGSPVVGREYTLRTASGKEIKGITDASGKTRPIAADTAEPVTLVLEAQSTMAIS